MHADRWQDYLENFKREMVTDKALEFMDCDPKDDGQAIWKELIPQFGVRIMFKTLWNERSSDSKSTANPRPSHVHNATTTGMVVLEHGDDDGDELYGSGLVRSDTNQEEEGLNTNLRRTTPAGGDGDV